MRRLLAVLVTALVAVVLPASAASAGTPVGTVTGVTSAVNERTPLYHLELVFTVEDVQCPAVVDYEMASDMLSAPVDQCTADPTGFFEVATATTMRPMFGPGLGTINPGGTDCDDGIDLGPGCQVDVFVRHADAPLELIDDRILLDGNGDPVEITIPPRPVWVGLGDGYTSRVTQMADWCYEDSADAEAAGRTALGVANVYADAYGDGDPRSVECSADAPYIDPDTGLEVYFHPVTGDYYYYDPDTDVLRYYNPETDALEDAGAVTVDDLEAEIGQDFFLTALNAPRQSWIESVVQTFNLEFAINDTSIPCANETDDSRCWKVVPEVIADETVSAADLADGGTDPTGQLSQLEALLTSARHQGSWNWVGLSAGLRDAGIPQAIQARYPTDGGNYLYEPLDGTGYVPWRPAGGDPCPAIPTMSSATADAVQAGIENVISKAMTWSPGLKAMVVRYPWLTEVTSTATGETNACAPANRAPISALNAAIDAAVASFPASDDVYQLDLAAEIDLNSGFTDEPTDSVPGRRSFLQLTRPYGYPYPSDYGTSSMGEIAYTSIEESGLQPPTISGVVVQADDDDPDSPSTDAENLRNSAGWYRQSGLYVEWRADAPEGVASLSRRSPLLRGANRDYTGSVVDLAGQTANAPATVSWDPDPPRVASTLTGGTFNLASGWYLSRPTVNWQVLDDVNISQYTGRHAPSGAAVVPPPISSYPDGKGVVVTSGTASDVAGNTATGQRTLNVDTERPSLTSTVSTGTGWSNATSATVTWHRLDTISGLAGVSSHPNGLVGILHSFPSPDVSAEGRTTVGHTVSDIAGNSTSGSVDVLLDRTAPRVFIKGSFPSKVDPAKVASQIAAIKSKGCDGEDLNPNGANEISKFSHCTMEVGDPEVGDGELIYTFVVTGWDHAGNKAVIEQSFTVEVTDPPELEGEYVTSATAAGWWNDDVEIDWTATPALGFGLHADLGDLYSGNWSISSGSGVGTFRSTHADEGVYSVTSPDACHKPQPGAPCAEPISKQVKLDKSPPRVDPTYDGPSGSGGWFRGPVTVGWSVGDAVPVGLDENEVSGVPSAALPSPTVAGEGITVVSTGQVSDRAGNTNSGSVTVKVDSEAPTIEEVTGVTDGDLHTQFDLPTVNGVTCSAVDLPPASAPTAKVSTVDANGCKVARFIGGPSTDPYGAPLREVTWQTVASDVAGNVRHGEMVTRLLDVEPSMRGRMTVGGKLQTSGSYGTVSTSGTLRCNGSPNNLGVSWNGGSFTLDWIDSFYCWDQDDLEATPEAPIDTLFGVGKGELSDGRAASIEWTFADRDSLGQKGTMRIVISVLGGTGDGRVVLDVGGVLTGGNFQAHDAEGNGTNDNGNVNGPTGNTSNQLVVAPGDVTAVLPQKPKLS